MTMMLLLELKSYCHPVKKHSRKVYQYQKGDYESIREGAFRFAKVKYFIGHSDSRLVQENLNLIT